MKNKLKLILLIIIIIILAFYIYKLTIKNHNVTYKVDNYTIEESFYINKDHYYDFIIKNNKKIYTYTKQENFNKQEKVITKIKTYKSNNLSCIIPIYKKETNNDIYCNLDGVQTSNYYLLENKDFNKILKQAKKYKVNIPQIENTKTHYKNINVYQKNISQNHKYMIWNYKGLYIMDSEDIKYQKFLDYDLYDNIMATVVDKYYVLFENPSVKGIEKYALPALKPNPSHSLFCTINGNIS